MCASVRISTEFRLLVRGRAGGVVGRRETLQRIEIRKGGLNGVGWKGR